MSTRGLSLATVDPRWITAALVLVAVAVYVTSNPARQNVYNHFVWQADAFLHGRFAIEWPVRPGEGRLANDYFQDVYPLADEPGRALLPFPPLPALMLVPLVAIFGLHANAALVAALLGAVNVGLAWHVALAATPDRRAALLAAIFYGFGTVAWYAAMLGSTWFLAHVVASTCLLLAIALALAVERGAAERRGDSAGHRRPGLLALVDPVQVAVGVLFGLAVLARLTTVFAAPFFALVGSGGSAGRRAISAAIGAAIPVGLLLAYNVVSSGHLFHPAYNYLYQNEYTPRPDLIHRDWAAEDVRYIPQNSAIALVWPPEVRPECGPSLVGECPLLKPDPLGMGLLLTSPGYLLAIAAFADSRRRRLVVAAAGAVALIALVNLAHFSQGWVQFGYRFSNDFAPFALILVALGIARLGVRPLTIALVTASIAVNAWGVHWGVTLGW